MRLSSITEMAAKQFCPTCHKTMAANHYWYKGGWRCKGGGKSVDAAQVSNVSQMPAKSNPIPADFAQKLAAIKFGDEITLKDKTVVRFLGGSATTDPRETLYPVRVASGPDQGQLLMVRPDEMDI